MKNCLGNLGSCITPDQLAAIVKNRLKPPSSTDSSLRPDSASNPTRPRTRPWPFGLCSSTCVRPVPTQDLFPMQESLCTAHSQQIAWSQAPVPLGVCHSDATQPNEVYGFMFENGSQPGAPLRNRTVDLLLTMDRCAVLQPQVDRLNCENPSTHWHSQAPDEPTRAPFATQSATHFDLVSERADRHRNES